MTDQAPAILTEAAPFDDSSEELLDADQVVFDDFIDDNTAPFDDDTAARLAKLEAAARDLATAAVTREARRVKRKVAAATTGAGATGLLPLLLQLLGVYDLDPAIAGMLSTLASLIGAFAAGWATPERTPPVPAASALLDD